MIVGDDVILMILCLEGYDVGVLFSIDFGICLVIVEILMFWFD